MNRDAEIARLRDRGIVASEIARRLSMREGAVNTAYARVLERRREAESQERSRFLLRWRYG